MRGAYLGSGLVGPNGQPLWPDGARLAADNLALPTAPDVLATTLLFDGINLDLQRAASATGVAVGTVGVQAQAPHVWNGSGYVPLSAPSQNGDGGGGTGVTVGNFLYNPATGWDRERGNTEGTLLAIAARTASALTANQTNHNGRGVVLNLKVTAKAAATTLTINLFAIDPVTGTPNQQIASSAAFAAGVGAEYLFVVYPGVVAADTPAAANVTPKSLVVPRTWAIQVIPSDANSVTYSVGYAYVI